MDVSHIILASFCVSAGYLLQPTPVPERPCSCHCNCSTRDSGGPSGLQAIIVTSLLILGALGLLIGLGYLAFTIVLERLSQTSRIAGSSPKGKFSKGTFGPTSGLQILDG